MLSSSIRSSPFSDLKSSISTKQAPQLFQRALWRLKISSRIKSRWLSKEDYGIPIQQNEEITLKVQPLANRQKMKQNRANHSI
tara:strand:- start:1385 stop:1633 length:249 start_codon:yes stop_codon:yes gene_type:complete